MDALRQKLFDSAKPKERARERGLLDDTKKVAIKKAAARWQLLRSCV